MRVTRRNVLIVLGILTVAGGTLFGAGAFSSVEAERTVTAETAGDSGAYLNLAGDEAYVSETGTDGTIEFQFDSLNENATSTFDGVLTVTAEPADSSGPYTLYIDDSDSSISGSPMDITNGSSSIVGSENSMTLDANTGQDLNVEFDLQNGDISNMPETITIVAEEA